MPKTDAVILETKDLCKQFTVHGNDLMASKQTLYALDGVSLSLHEGETLGVIGESGCGKSTFGRCIVGLHRPTSGTIAYKGTPIDMRGGKGYRPIRRSLQMIFQDPYSSLNPKKTCGQLIEEPLLIHKIGATKAEREEIVARYMKAVGLDAQHVHRYPHEFSGGQRQRINIARALTMSPEVIVCDEPVSALDVSIQAQVLNLFSELQEQYGLSYIFISHDLSVVRYVSDRIAIMYLGSVVELCPAGEVYENPLHPYTRALLSAVPPMSPFEKKERIELKGDIPSPIGKRAGCPLAGRCPNCTERCRTEKPLLKEHGQGHEVACFLYE